GFFLSWTYSPFLNSTKLKGPVPFISVTRRFTSALAHASGITAQLNIATSARKGAHGWLSLTTTVASSGGWMSWTATMVNVQMLAGSFFARPIEYLTSLAFNGDPSWKVTPWRRWKV